MLDQAAIGEYLARRFPPAAPHAAALGRLARTVYGRTEGNPLFVVNVAADLVSHGVLVERDGLWEVAENPDGVHVAVPGDVRGMIARQLDRLDPDERRILEVASAAGAEFSSAAVAAAAEVDIGAADACCADLARREAFLAARGADEWPDGTLAGRYGFRHALYQEVVYEHLPPGRRAELHRRIGMRLEAAFGERVGEVAAELAMHFRRGHDVGRAIRHLHRAGEIATRRSAAREAVAHLTEALDLLRALPDSPARDQQEVTLRISLGAPLMATRGWGAPEVERAYARAQELCEKMGDPPQLFQALWGLWQFRTNHAELDVARALGERLLTLARRTDEPAIVLEAHHALWTSRFFDGQLLDARDHVARGIALYDPDQHASLASVYGSHDPGVCGRAIGAWALELLGDSDGATGHSRDAVALARRLGHPFSETHALILAAFLHRLRGDWRRCRQLAEEAGAIAREHGFIQLHARATTMRGWAVAQGGEIEDGIAQMRDGIDAIRALGPTFLPYLLAALADGWAGAGRTDAALDAITEALATVARTGERFYAAELHRFKGELLLARAPHDATEVERCFRTARGIARGQRAETLERRAIGSLHALLVRQGRGDEARQLAAAGEGGHGDGAARG
jgi:predicted ATPase